MQLYLSKLFTSESYGNLTREALTSAKCLCELWLHLNELVLRDLYFLLPRSDRGLDLFRNSSLVNSEQDIAHPFLIKVTPPIFIGQVLEKLGLAASILKEIFDRQAINLWHCSDFDS